MLEVDNLTVEYETDEGTVRACEDVSFELDEGEVLGIVGESGCGKSTVGKAVLRLLPPNGYVESGTVRFNSTNLFEMSREELRRIRWEELVIIPQSSMDAFDPVYTVREQIVEAIQTHQDVTRKAANKRVRELFEMVSLDPKRMNDYPHELSGGMSQRAVIAMALALEPKLIIADEITTALDVVTQDSILKEIEEYLEDKSTSMIMISHDMGVIHELCDTIMVMYAGEAIEKGPTRDLVTEPHHPYTIGLQNAFPQINEEDLVSIPGTPPNLINPPEGCRFASRCPFSTEDCRQQPPLIEVGDEHTARCVHTNIAEEMRVDGQKKTTWDPQS